MYSTLTQPTLRTLGVLFSVVTLSLSAYESVFKTAGVENWKKYLFLAAILIAMVLVLIDWWSYNRNKPKKYGLNSSSINEYMKEWLQKGGRCLILSRNMSWVQDAELELLKSKATAGDLELLVGEKNSVISELEKDGARVFDYSLLNFVPSSRFTIIDYEKSGEQIAIGKGRDGKHLITEHSKNDDDVFVLAKDLKNALKAACSNG